MQQSNFVASLAILMDGERLPTGRQLGIPEVIELPCETLPIPLRQVSACLADYPSLCHKEKLHCNVQLGEGLRPQEIRSCCGPFRLTNHGFGYSQ